MQKDKQQHTREAWRNNVEWEVHAHVDGQIYATFIFAVKRAEAKSKVLEKAPWLKKRAQKVTAAKASSYTVPFHIRLRVEGYAVFLSDGNTNLALVPCDW
jgi:hypothetical protein